MVFTEMQAPETQKPCARLRDADRDPVAAFYPLSPSRRIAAGHAFFLGMIFSENRISLFGIMPARDLFKVTRKSHASVRELC
jgi:hypothetical protein